MEQEQKYTRPENLLKALGIDYKGLSEEERVMQKLLAEEYKKRGTSLINDIKKWRENNPQATIGDAIRALYEAEENQK